MKKNILFLFFISLLSTVLQSMEDTPIHRAAAHKRKHPETSEEVKPETSSKKVHYSAQWDTTEQEEFSANLGWHSLPAEMQDTILHLALSTQPSQALKTLKKLELVNKELSAWALNYLKKAAPTWVNNDPEDTANIFVQAAATGNQPVFHTLIDAGINIDKPGKSQESAVQAAARTGNIEIVNELIESAAHVDPLTLMAANKHPDIIRLLLTAGAILVDGNLKAQLLSAVILDQKKRAEILIAKGANVDGQDKNLLTSLMYASALGHKKIVKLLLRNYADVYQMQGELKMNALMFAARYGQLAIVKLFLKRNIRFDLPSLIKLARNFEHKDIENLLAPEDEALKKSWSIYLAFERACQTKDKNIINSLIEQLADKEKNLNPFFVYAASRGNKSLMKKLRKYRINLNTELSYGETALICASRNGHDAVVRKLINWKADIDAQDDLGKTALMYAIEQKHTNIANLLLDVGADTELDDIYGCTAGVMALKNNDQTLLRRIYH